MPISEKIAGYLEKGSWIRKMFEEGARLKALYGEEQIFDFSLGNPPEEPPEAFLQALRDLLANPAPGMHRYMSNAGFPEVRESVAQGIAEACGLPVEGQNVVMTVGAGGALNVALKALLDPDDEVVVIAPFFVEYRFYVDNHGGRSVVVSTDEDFLLDLDAMDRAIGPKTKAVILNSPNNPTGVVYPEAQVRALGDLLRDKERALGRDIYVISDEPYRKLLYDGIAYPHIFHHIDNALVATSHSKDLALAGERIGYLVASPKCADLQRLLEAMVFANRTLGFVNAPALMQRIVARLQHVSVDVAAYQQRRDLLYQTLTALGFEMVKPQGGFYLFPKSLISNDVAFVQAALRKHILVAPGTGFGTPGYFRIAYSVPISVIERSLDAWTSLAKEF